MAAEYRVGCVPGDALETYLNGNGSVLVGGVVHERPAGAELVQVFQEMRDRRFLGEHLAVPHYRVIWKLKPGPQSKEPRSKTEDEW